MDYNSIIAKLEEYNYVSFDIFETLVYRSVGCSKNIFKEITERQKEYSACIPETFPIDRRLAEQKARNFLKKEVTLNQIYDFIEGYDDNQKNQLINLEKVFEVDCCIANKKMQKVYNYCKQKGKKIFLVSDMYLSKKQIEKILYKCGYSGYCELYVSCEHNASKSNGSLFKLVVDECNIKPSELIHIGDNIKSDFFMAKMSGIKAIHLANDYNRFSNNKWVMSSDDEYVYSVMNSFIEASLKTKDSYATFGYSCLGPMVLGFCRWMNKKIKEKGIKNVVFFAREGKFIKRAFETYYPDYDFNINYVYVSRKSLAVASILRLNTFKEIRKMLSLRSRENVKGFLYNLNMDSDEKYIDKLKSKGINLEDSIDTEIFENFINDTIEDIRAKARENAEIVIQYFKENHMYEKVAIVDIGWSGTMQNAVAKICQDNEIDIELHGFYFGVRRQSKKNRYVNSYKYGFLYDALLDDRLEDFCRSMNGLLEICFAADHGTTLGYRISDKKVVPILGPEEMPPLMKKQIEIIQDAAIEFLLDVKGNSILNSKEYSRDVAFANFARVGGYPKKKDFKIFKDFIVNNVISTGLIERHSYLEYVVSPKLIKRDLMLSGWKMGYLRQLIKIPVPYFKLFKFIQKYKN